MRLWGVSGASTRAVKPTCFVLNYHLLFLIANIILEWSKIFNTQQYEMIPVERVNSLTVNDLGL